MPPGWQPPRRDNAHGEKEIEAEGGEGDGDETYDKKKQTSNDRLDLADPTATGATPIHTNYFQHVPQQTWGYGHMPPRDDGAYMRYILTPAQYSSTRMPRGKGPAIQGDYTGPSMLHYHKIDPCKSPERCTHSTSTNIETAFYVRNKDFFFEGRVGVFMGKWTSAELTMYRFSQ
jgi:hypothetical protein